MRVLLPNSSHSNHVGRTLPVICEALRINWQRQHRVLRNGCRLGIGDREQDRLIQLIDRVAHSFSHARMKYIAVVEIAVILGVACGFCRTLDTLVKRSSA